MKNFITRLLSDNKSSQYAISSKRFVLVTSALVFGICILVSTYAELINKHVSFATELIYALASVAGGSYVGGKFSEINRKNQSDDTSDSTSPENNSSPPQPLVSSTDTSTDTSDTETEEDSGTDTPVKNVTKKSK